MRRTCPEREAGNCTPACVFAGCGCLGHVWADNVLLLRGMEYTHLLAISALMASPGLLRLAPALNPIPHVLHKTWVRLSSFTQHIWDSNCPVCQQKGVKVRGGGVGDGTWLVSLFQAGDSLRVSMALCTSLSILWWDLQLISTLICTSAPWQLPKDRQRICNVSSI